MPTNCSNVHSIAIPLPSLDWHNKHSVCCVTVTDLSSKLRLGLLFLKQKLHTSLLFNTRWDFKIVKTHFASAKSLEFQRPPFQLWPAGHITPSKNLSKHGKESTVPLNTVVYLNSVVSIPLCTHQIFYYLSRLYTTYSNSCKLLQLVNYATCFGLSTIIRLTHKYGLIKV